MKSCIFLSIEGDKEEKEKSKEQRSEKEINLLAMSEVLIKQLNELKKILQFTRNGVRRNNVPKIQLQRAMADIKKILKLMMIEPRGDDRHYDPHFYVDCFSSLLLNVSGQDGIKQLVDLIDIIIKMALNSLSI